MIRFGSVCSGIEAASVAWHPLGWRASFLSEIEAFPRAVLAHHYPETPLHGDFTTISAGEYDPIDLLVGGTPCQSFSVAGLRGGLDDDRGNLALEYLRLADRLRPRWLVWENVPGVLSSNGGRDFGAILGGMVELGYGVAYRVLDAQFFGVAQRRRRVFVVGYLGDWRRAAAVLFERHSLSGHPAPRREARQTAPTIPSRSTGGGGLGTDFDCDGGLISHVPQISPALKARVAKGPSSDGDGAPLIAHALRGEGFDASEDGTGRRTPIVPVAFRTTGNDGCYETGDAVGALTRSTDPTAQSIAFSAKDHGADAMTDLSPTLRAGGHSKSHANAGVTPAVAFPINPNALRGDTHAKTLSKDAAGVMRLRNPGLGIGDAGDPADTLQAAGPGAVAIAEPFTLAIRGRKGGHNLEARQDGTANAILTPNGGRAGMGVGAVAFTQNQRDELRQLEVAGALAAEPGMKQQTYVGTSAVRRLTPVECARLQGFPDDYLTQVPWRGKPSPPDGPQYKALGNSMAVPCMAWIGRRIAAVEALALLPTHEAA